jgi:hypothetical protein
MTDAELAAEAARWTGRILPLEGFFTRTRDEFKDWIVWTLLDAFRCKRVPLGMPPPQVRVMDSAEVLVDGIMEEDEDRTVIWVKVTL